MSLYDSIINYGKQETGNYKGSSKKEILSQINKTRKPTQKEVQREVEQQLQGMMDSWANKNKKKKKNVVQKVADYIGSGKALNDAVDLSKKEIRMIVDPKYRNDVAKKAANSAAVGSSQVAKGTVKTLENWYDTLNQWDFAVNEGAARKLGITSEEEYQKKKQDLENKVKQDWTGDLWKYGFGWDEDNENFLKQNSYVTGENTAGQLLESVGQQVPAMIIGNAGMNYMTGGKAIEATKNAYQSLKALKGAEKAKAIAGNVGKAAMINAGSNAEIFARSYGAATEEALQQGATLEQASKYGVLNAMTEIGTEWLTSGIPGVEESTGLLSNGASKLLDKTTGKIKKEPLRQITRNILEFTGGMAGEGLEEALSEFISPYIKNATYTSGEKVNLNNILTSFLMGAASAGILDFGGKLGGKLEAKTTNINQNETQQANQLADNQVQEIQQAVEQGQTTPQEGTEAVEQVKERLNQVAQESLNNTYQETPQNRIVEQETTQDNINPLQQQNDAQNAIKEVQNKAIENQSNAFNFGKNENVVQKNIKQQNDIEDTKNNQVEQQPTQTNTETQAKQTNIPETKTEPVKSVDITGDKGKQYFMDSGADEKVAQILSEKPKQKTNKLENAKDVAGQTYRLIVSKGGEVERIAQITKRPDVKYKYDKAMRYQAEANQHIGKSQTDLNYKPYKNFKNADGETVSMSLNDIRKDAKQHNISEQTLNEYLAHNLNVGRYMEDKPVFGKNVTKDDSLNRIAEIEKEHPEIKRIAKNVWTYEQNELKNTYESGRISEELYNKLSKNEHYVRIQRNIEKGGNNNAVLDKNGKIKINQGIQKATGGNQDILPILETIAQRTVENTRANRINESVKELASAMSMGSEDNSISAIDNEESFGVNPDLFKQNDDGTYTMTFFNNGVATVVPINKAIYDAYTTNKAISAFENAKATKTITKPGRVASSMFRTLTTDKNPMFMLTNAFKDIGDAPFNSKYTKEFAKAYTSTQALREVIGDGGYNKLYNRAGGESDSYFTEGEFKDKTQSKAGKALETLLTPIEKGNQWVEKTPRMAEFIATIKANGYDVNSDGEMFLKDSNKAKGRSAESVLDEALYNAAEVTTNFKRGGDLSKMLNRNGATFLNASIQGFDKQVRNFKDAATGDKKKIIALLTKALIFGIAPTALNDAMNDDDEEYQNTQDYIKDNYYIFKGKDGEYNIRIPKGRAMSVIGSAYRRTKDYVKGDKDAYKGFAKFASGQVAPNNPFENNILSPIFAVKNNKSWAGNKIVSESMEKRPAAEQYNEKTDEFSKWLGKKINVSPMKINYLIDQYTGGVGDVVLPTITPKATSKTSNPLLQPFISKFTYDPVYQQKNVGDFYDEMNKAETKKSSLKATKDDKVKYSYLYSQNQKMAELKKKQSEIQNDKSLSNKEKYEQAREIQKEINKLAKDSVKNSNNIKDHKYYAIIGDNTYRLTKDSEGNDVWSKDAYAESHKKSAKKKGMALYDYYKQQYEKKKNK